MEGGIDTMKTNRLSVYGFVFAIIGGVCGILAAINSVYGLALVGLIIAVVGLIAACKGGNLENEASGGYKSGLATAGKIIAIIAIVISGISYVRGNYYSSLHKSLSTKSTTTNLKSEPDKSDYQLGEPIATAYDTDYGRWIEIFVPITNTSNRNLYLKSSNMEIEDGDGHLIYTLEDEEAVPQVLAPGETGYLIGIRSGVEDVIVDDNFSVVAHADVDFASVPLDRYTVDDVTFSSREYSDTLEVIGRIYNPTSSDSGTLSRLYIIPLDSNGNPLCVISDYPDEVNAGETIAFSAYQDGQRAVSPDDISSYVCFAYPYQIQFSG